MVEIKPLIKSWKEKNLKNPPPPPVTGGGFHTPEIRKFAFLSDIWFKYNYFSTRHYLSTASYKYPKKSKIKLLYITFGYLEKFW